jgi:alkylation response protein AidB-like acyl-CoA dehydrogenase
MLDVAVDLALSAEQVAVQEAFAEFFAKESPIQVVRYAEPLGFSAQLWKQLAATGAPAMGMPGSGADSLTLCLVAEQIGRRLAPVPLLDSWVATALLGQLDPALAEPLGDGSSIGALALDPARDGSVRLVPSGAVASSVVALDGADLVLLRRSEPPPQQANFGSSPLADWAIAGTDRTVLANGAAALELHRAGRALWKLLLSAALNGIQAAALEIAVGYVQTREAFGRPIAWFQAIQHRLADVAVAGDGARYLTYEAAWARDGERADEADRLAAMAAAFSAETSFYTCREALQFHGGYGYTLEYDIQLYYRRAKAWPLLLGDPRLELRAIAELTHPEED